MHTQTNPNFAGQITSQATQDFREAGNPNGFGEHTSDPTGAGPSRDHTGRNGLANALTERGQSLHPSIVIQTICDLPGPAAGCP
jgi:hypothetical protein